ncbi:MAG TPA: hypothetical protein VHB23_01205 [Devosiaceae bacterium]|nr:hypothetical protein [Devosiaceae bacterium]
MATTIDPSNAAQLFTHLRILMGTVVGLGMGRLLMGFAGIVQHPTRARLSATHLVWASSVLLTLIHFWWWEFALFTVSQWWFGDFLFLITYCAALFLLCVLLFPDDIKEYDGYEDFFMSRRAWFFGVFAATVIFDIFDSGLKGWDYLHDLDLEYAIEVPIALVLCVIAIATRNGRFHLAIALLQFAYQISWVVRAFDDLA